MCLLKNNQNILCIQIIFIKKTYDYVLIIGITNEQLLPEESSSERTPSSSSKQILLA